MKKQIFAALAALALTFAAQQSAGASDAAPVTVDNYGRKVTVTEMPQRARSTTTAAARCPSTPPSTRGCPS